MHMKRMKSLRATLLVLMLGCFGASIALASDLTLASAKQQGLVGEQHDGYLGVVDGGSSAAQQLVASVNAKRRAEYERIAKANSISVADVESLAGQKALQKTASGHYVKAQGQSWRKK